MPEGLALDQLHRDVVLAVAGFTERERVALYKLDRHGPGGVERRVEARA